MNTPTQRKFGLLTTVAMIAGIVVGSGIFFKTDDILQAVNGNIQLGVLGWILGAVGIIFGGLTIASYAKVEDNVGGIITYSEMAWGKTLGYLAGWFQIIFYYPALVAIISWVAASYMLVLFNQPGPFSTGEFTLFSWVLTVFLLIFFFIVNTLATKQAGKFQSFAFIAKISALLVLAIGGLTLGAPTFSSTTISTGGGGLFVALISIAFAYDGWLVAPSIAHEIKHPKRNLPLALTFSPLLILVVYVSYFLGLNALLGPEKILELGNGAVGEAATLLFGPIGPVVVFTFVVISVLGTLNGLILGYIRLPYALAVRDEIIASQWLKQVSKKYQTPVYASVFALIISFGWLILHFISTLENSILTGLSIDNLPIVLTYFFYILLYVKVLIGNKDASTFFKKDKLFALFAIFGALIVIIGGFLAENAARYILVSLIGIGAGLLIRGKKRDLI